MRGSHRLAWRHAALRAAPKSRTVNHSPRGGD